MPTSAPTSTITPISSGLTPNVVAQNFCPSGLERCCPPNGYSCGIRYPPISSAQPPTAGQAVSEHNFITILGLNNISQGIWSLSLASRDTGNYPLTCIIIGLSLSIRLQTTADAFIASGALIDHLHIITAAHKVSTIVSQGQQLKVRVGEYNALAATEPIPVQEFFVSRVFIHPQFTSANLKNDIAILRTSAAIPLGVSPVVSTVCLPSIMLTAGTRCFIAGLKFRNKKSRNIFIKHFMQAGEKMTFQQRDNFKRFLKKLMYQLWNKFHAKISLEQRDLELILSLIQQALCVLEVKLEKVIIT